MTSTPEPNNPQQGFRLIADPEAFSREMDPQGLDAESFAKIARKCLWLGTPESGGLFHNSLPPRSEVPVGKIPMWEKHVVNDSKWRYMLTRIWRARGAASVYQLGNKPARQETLAFEKSLVPQTLEIPENDHLAVFIGLNPSTATHLKNDPTITRCEGFAKSWGCRGMIMLNLFAWRDVSPAAMKLAGRHAEGEFNRFIVSRIVNQSEIVVACWGTHGGWRNQQTRIMREWLPEKTIKRIKCLKLTSGGFPGHPLYIKAGTPLSDFSIPKE